MMIDARWNDVFAHLALPDNSGLPKYQRLVNAFIHAISSGIWQPGDRLPPEEELTGLTPYSLGTVQRALRELSDQGLVIRQHGLGSFVATHDRELRDPWHCRFLADDQQSVLPVYSQVLGRQAVTENGPWTRWLGATAPLMRVDRVISVNKEFNIYSRFYADCERLHRLWSIPLEDLHGANFKQLMLRDCGLPITEITHLVSVAPFDAEVGSHVDIPAGESGLYVQAIAQAGRNSCVYFQEFFLGRTQRPMKFPEITLSVQ